MHADAWQMQAFAQAQHIVVHNGGGACWMGAAAAVLIAVLHGCGSNAHTSCWPSVLQLVPHSLISSCCAVWTCPSSGLLAKACSSLPVSELPLNPTTTSCKP